MLKITKTALITGASGSLGKAMVGRFLEGGWTVYGTHHRSEPGAGLPQSPNLHWLSMDLADSRSIETAMRGVREKGTEFDTFVHTAGGFRYAPLEQTLDEDIEFLIHANLKSAFLMTRELLPGMKERNYGRIIFISSKSIEAPPAGMSIYAATKAGLSAFAQSIQQEVKELNININTLLPTVIDTPTNRRDMPKADFSAWVSPEQLANIAMSLVSDWGNPIRGASLAVTGKV